MSVHPSAVVSPTARIGGAVGIGPLAVVEDDTTIGDGCEVRAHAVIKRFTTLGAHNRVHEGAVLGGEPQDLAFGGQDTALVIGDRNVIREGVTIHRSTKPGGATVVGSDCFLMAYVHVAHDNRIGDRAILANNVMLAGHVEVGASTFIGGGAGIHQFCRIGESAMVAGLARITRDVAPFLMVAERDEVPGFNLVGLKRRGLSRETIREIKDCYAHVFRSGDPRPLAAARLAAGVNSPEARRFLEFFAGGKRGFARPARGDESTSES